MGASRVLHPCARDAIREAASIWRTSSNAAPSITHPSFFIEPSLLPRVVEADLAAGTKAFHRSVE
jgi:hypothetical protein